MFFLKWLPDQLSCSTCLLSNWFPGVITYFPGESVIEWALRLELCAVLFVPQQFVHTKSVH